MRQVGKALVFSMVLAAGLAASAATISLSPVSLEAQSPAKGTKLTLENRGPEPVAVQLRVFKWEKKNGMDSLTPTNEVVASPPMAKLKPKSKYTVRIVRLAKRPIAGEESFRLLVDQLPQPSQRSSSGVNFLIRQSIPVFFAAGQSERSPLQWAARVEGHKLILEAANQGKRRVRLSDIRLHGPKGRLSGQEVFSGYVLAGSIARWAQPLPAGIAPGARLTITAQDEHGPIQGSAIIAAAD